MIEIFEDWRGCYEHGFVYYHLKYKNSSQMINGNRSIIYFESKYNERIVFLYDGLFLPSVLCEDNCYIIKIKINKGEYYLEDVLYNTTTKTYLL